MLWKHHYGDTKILWILKRRTTRIQIATALRRSKHALSPLVLLLFRSHKPFFACETLSRINWKFIKFSAFFPEFCAPNISIIFYCAELGSRVNDVEVSAFASFTFQIGGSELRAQTVFAFCFRIQMYSNRVNSFRLLCGSDGESA